MAKASVNRSFYGTNKGGHDENGHPVELVDTCRLK